MFFCDRDGTVSSFHGSRIGDHLDGTTCQVFAKNLKVQIAEGVLYPDVMVLNP